MPYRVDRNVNGGRIMLFVREDILSKLLSVENSPTEAFFVERCGYSVTLTIQIEKT